MMRASKARRISEKFNRSKIVNIYLIKSKIEEMHSVCSIHRQKNKQ